MGVRYNEEDTAQTLDRLFSRGPRIADPQVPDNYAVALYTRGGRKRELNLLVKGAQQLVRTRSRARVLRGLLNYLSADLASHDPALLQIRTAAVVRDGSATILPFEVTSWLPDLQPRLNRYGGQLVDAPWVLIDPATAELVVPEPTVEHRRRCARRTRPRRPVGTRAAAAAPRPLRPGLVDHRDESRQEVGSALAEASWPRCPSRW